MKDRMEIESLDVVPLRKKMAYSANQLGINMLWNAFNTVAVFFYVTQLKVSGVELSTGMIVYGIINAGLNLLAGHFSDRTHTQWGRRIPYIVAAGLPFCIAFYFLFSPPMLHPQGLLVYFLLLTFIFDIGFTLTALNVGSLFPEMYQEEKSRVYVSAMQQVFGIIGLIIGVALSKSLGQTLGWSTMAIIFAIISVVSIYVSLYGSFENPTYRQESFQLGKALKATFQNKRFLMYVVASFLVQLSTTMFTTVSSFYTKYVVDMSALQSSLFLGGIFLVAMPVSFIWAKIAIRMSTVKAAMISTVLYMGTILAFLFDKSPISVIVTGFSMGISISGFLVLLNVLLADVIDYDAFLTGRRREGMYLGMNGFIVRLGLSVQYAIMAIFFSVSGYNSQLQVQNAGTVFGFRFLLGGLPIFFMLIALLMLGKYHRLMKPMVAHVSNTKYDRS
ncbi:MAG: MFS transporter [Acidibacillus sp.]|uniref:Isoprimeverose transporter n=1 Tax=Sulfoacidibacillus ferrooxidans TaxID=2005001 RepID=A0A9X1V714_9BACL|nr:MFS transporter [Sulfoacidibacillus ferrooxidans]MCI0182209.1 Isoprimeverose transporter [Sulfoacidibacillus ferrooxidans]MCY0893842.1 MFS transporter [Acidibacillus sp.]